MTVESVSVATSQSHKATTAPVTESGDTPLCHRVMSQGAIVLYFFHTSSIRFKGQMTVMNQLV